MAITKRLASSITEIRTDWDGKKYWGEGKFWVHTFEGDKCIRSERVDLKTEHCSNYFQAWVTLSEASFTLLR